MNDGHDDGETVGQAPPPAGRALVQPTIHTVDGLNVVIDADLALLLGVSTSAFNQQVRRNLDRFPPGWMFELDEAAYARLKSQAVMANAGRGGRRTAPLVFTEHGVVMAASLMSSQRATLILQFVIEVFVSARRGELAGKPIRVSDAPAATGFSQKLQVMIEKIMATLVDGDPDAALREEAQAMFRASIQHIRDRLERVGLENEEIAARAAKLLAEAEATKAAAAKTRAEAEDIKLGTLARKLELVMKAEAAISRGEIRDFMSVLRSWGTEAAAAVARGSKYFLPVGLVGVDRASAACIWCAHSHGRSVGGCLLHGFPCLPA